MKRLKSLIKIVCENKKDEEELNRLVETMIYFKDFESESNTIKKIFNYLTTQKLLKLSDNQKEDIITLTWIYLYLRDDDTAEIDNIINKASYLKIKEEYIDYINSAKK